MLSKEFKVTNLSSKGFSLGIESQQVWETSSPNVFSGGSFHDRDKRDQDQKAILINEKTDERIDFIHDGYEYSFEGKKLYRSPVEKSWDQEIEEYSNYEVVHEGDHFRIIFFK